MTTRSHMERNEGTQIAVVEVETSLILYTARWTVKSRWLARCWKKWAWNPHCEA
ncbi:hypothetical protein BJY04DRAFT_197525 [Aspergillus karnatakaensis]|uniref:uncharacterized protein n=1 Tax=Aspergillus karnatakaensis TaxID=1810916 RepID=UPI003CCD2FD1